MWLINILLVSCVVWRVFCLILLFCIVLFVVVSVCFLSGFPKSRFNSGAPSEFLKLSE